jgi:hypothetical protein
MNSREVAPDSSFRPRKTMAIVLLAVAVIAAPGLSAEVVKIVRPEYYQKIIVDFFVKLKFSRPSFDDGASGYVGDCSIASLQRHQQRELRELANHQRQETLDLFFSHQTAESRTFNLKVQLLKRVPFDDFNKRLSMLEKEFGLNSDKYKNGKALLTLNLANQLKLNDDLIAFAKPAFLAHQKLEQFVLRSHQVLERLSLLAHQHVEQEECSRMRAGKGR